MKKYSNQKNIIIFVVVLLLVFVFYGFEGRPMRIRRSCFVYVQHRIENGLINSDSLADGHLKKCLYKYGLDR